MGEGFQDCFCIQDFRDDFIPNPKLSTLLTLQYHSLFSMSS